MTLGHVTGFLASPFILYYLYMAFRGDLGAIGQSFRSRQNFKRMMEASTLNPHDADAQYQLGLIYQQRRQYSEAIARFQAAVKIDKMEADASIIRLKFWRLRKDCPISPKPPRNDKYR